MTKKISLPDGYRLTWADEFNSSTFDGKIWDAETHARGWIVGELQEYCGSECIEVKDGCLSIRPKITTNSFGEIVCLSGRLSSYGKVDFTYGKIVARVKVPKAAGLLSYIRLMPTTGYDAEECTYKEFPLHGQIDMVEVAGSRSDEAVSRVTFGYPHTERSGSFRRLNTDFANEFHIFSCEWNQDEIVFACDGKEYYRTSYWFERKGEEESPYPAPFDKPFHIVFGVSAGGRKLGAEAEIPVSLNDKDTEFLVDYIRVYQKSQYERRFVRPARVLMIDPTSSDGPENIENGRTDAFFAAEGDLSAKVTFMDDEMIITPAVSAGNAGETRLVHGGCQFKKGESYEFSFDGRADEERTINCLCRADNGEEIFEPYTIRLDRTWQNHRMVFEAGRDYDDASVVFAIRAISKSSVHIRNIIIKKRVGNDNRRKLIAVCGVWDDSNTYSLFLRSLLTEEIRKEYVIASFSFTGDSPDPEQTQLEVDFANLLSGMELAGMIIFGEMIKTHDIIDRLVGIGHEKNVPVFTFQYPIKNCINADFDYDTAFESIVKHVIEEHGARKLDMMAGFKGNPFSEARINAFRKVLSDHGIDPESARIFYGDFWQAPAAKVMDDLFEDGYELPDAIICANDSMALGVCDSVRRNGHMIPEDVIVTGFDGTWQGQYNDPVLTTSELDYQAISEQIISAIKNWNAEQGAKETVLFPYRLRFMQSCGCKSYSEFQWSDIVVELAGESQDSLRHMMEMGRFVSRMTASDNLDDAADNLRGSIWMWRSQYYFVGVIEEDECCHSIFRGREAKYTSAQKFYRMKYPIPDYDLIMSPDMDINVLLFRQIKSNSESFGYVINGYSDLSIRSEQRFEEFSLFVNAAVNAVNSNRKLITKSKANEILSEQDFLTGLYNRRGFYMMLNDMINSSISSGKILSLFSIDMDKLKSINDRYGHENGDLAIQTLARAILKYVDDDGIAARYGGDEFAFFIIGNERLEGSIKTIRNEIEEAADSDPAMTDKPFEVGASIGISERVIDKNIDIEDMILEADSKMYADKMLRKRLYGG